MKQALQLRVGQQLTMTPQMQQAIRLLQMSAVELQAEVQEALESNLMLEAVEAEPESEPEPGWAPWPVAPAAPVAGLPDNQASEPPSLQGYLRWQLELTPFSAADARIALTLIEYIDDDGYLGASLDEIRAALPDGMDAGIDEIEAVLHRVQRFDPVGVGARSLAECLDVQLDQLDAATPGLALARRLVNGHLEELAGHRHEALAKKLGVGGAELETAVTLVRAQHPRPGAGLSSAPTEYVVPDVIAVRRNGCWQAELNPELQPKLRINPAYARLARDPAQSTADHACMREHLQEARWLLNSLQQRARTLLRVANFIINHQSAFLDHGDTAMKPLILREVAEALEMHESTVSRVTANKWMHTPRGVVEFRRFFSGQLNTADGGGASATAVRALIRRLVGEEDPRRPLSDNAVSARLAAMGYRVARRTVAKYREGMSIPPASGRRRAN